METHDFPAQQRVPAGGVRRSRDSWGNVCAGFILVRTRPAGRIPADRLV